MMTTTTPEFYPTQSTALVVYDPQAHSIAHLKTRAEKIQDFFMGQSFKAQRADYGYFHRHWMGDVIVLVGTSTAGKTSIIKALRQLEPDRVEDGVDLRADAALLNMLRKHAPDEVAMLEHCMNPLDIPKAVLAGERFYKTSTSEAQKTEAEKTIQTLKQMADALPQTEWHTTFENLEPKMFDEAFESVRRGGSVIFDVLNVDAVAQHALMRNFDGPMRIVLTYCPFHNLSSRMEQRTKEAQESGNLSNQRIGSFPLMQFGDIYTKREPMQRGLETITRAEAVKAFRDNFDKGTIEERKTGMALPPDDQILMRKEKMCQAFLEKLGFEDGIDAVEIAPRNQHFYHLMLNSSELVPGQSAEILHRQARTDFTHHLRD